MMPMLPCQYRNLAILSISALLCLLTLLLDRELLITLYKRFGFAVLMATSVYWWCALLPDRLPGRQSIHWTFDSFGVLVLAVLLTGLMFQVSPYQFRILADETNLVSVSYSMFMGRSFANVTESLYFFQQHHPLSSTLDIRPNFYPFLIYVIHVLRGYSAYNGFVVNFFAGVASLWLMYWLLRRWFHWPVALLGLFLLAAFPVYVLWVTASGFEIVNLAMALLAFCLLYRYLESREVKQLERLLLTLVLLAQTRYESSVFVIAIAIVVVLSLRPKHLSALHLRFAVIPWLFLPVAWHRLIKTDKADYQVYGGQDIFSLDNLLNNLPYGWDFFSGKEDWFGTIGWTFYLALLGFVVAVAKILLRRSRLSLTSEYVFLAAALSFLGLVMVVMSYYWGNLTFVFTLRLGIIFLPFIVVSVCYLFQEILALPCWRGQQQALGKLSLLAGLSLLLLYWPVAAKNEAVEKLTLNRLYQHTLNFLQREFPSHNNLIVTDRPGMYTVHQWGAVNGEYARIKYQKIVEGLQRRLYQNVLVIQEVSYETGQATEATAVPEQLPLEPLFETQFDAESMLRISKVVLQN